jgi:hypothetical protein
MPTEETEPDEHLYRVQYRLDAHPEGFTKEVAKKAVEEGFGSCDRAVLFSIVDQPEGGTTTMVLSLDGKTGPMDDGELFKAWSLLTHKLSQSRELGEGRRAFCEQTFEIIRKAVMAGRG